MIGTSQDCKSGQNT